MNYSDSEDHRVSNSVLLGVEFLCMFVGVGIWFVNNEIQAIPSLLDLASIAFMAALVSGTAFYTRFMQAGTQGFVALVMGVLTPLGLLLITAGANMWNCHSLLSTSLERCS